MNCELGSLSLDAVGVDEGLAIHLLVCFVLDILMFIESFDCASANVDSKLLSNESGPVTQGEPRPLLEELRGDESTLNSERDLLELAFALIKSASNKTTGLLEVSNITPHCW